MKYSTISNSLSLFLIVKKTVNKFEENIKNTFLYKAVNWNYSPISLYSKQSYFFGSEATL